MHATPPDTDLDAPRIQTRDDGDRSLLGRVLPMIALAVLAACVLESCLSPLPPSISAAPASVAPASAPKN